MNPKGSQRAGTIPPITDDALDAILVTQFLVAWAGEGRCSPKRYGWWDTDLVDAAGGGDLLARLAPRTHEWAALELVREAARRVDTRLREKHGDRDKLRTIFFLGFELDERLNDRLASHKRSGRSPAEVLSLPLPLTAAFSEDAVRRALAPQGPPAFEKVPPVGRQLVGEPPAAPDAVVRTLGAALIPPAEEYPLPFYRLGS